MFNERAGHSAGRLLFSLTRRDSSFVLTFSRCRMTLRLCVSTRLALISALRIVFRKRTGSTVLSTLSKGQCALQY